MTDSPRLLTVTGGGSPSDAGSGAEGLLEPPTLSARAAPGEVGLPPEGALPRGQEADPAAASRLSNTQRVGFREGVDRQQTSGLIMGSPSSSADASPPGRPSMNGQPKLRSPQRDSTGPTRGSASPSGAAGHSPVLDGAPNYMVPPKHGTFRSVFSCGTSFRERDGLGLSTTNATKWHGRGGMYRAPRRASNGRPVTDWAAGAAARRRSSGSSFGSAASLLKPRQRRGSIESLEGSASGREDGTGAVAHRGSLPARVFAHDHDHLTQTVGTVAPKQTGLKGSREGRLRARFAAVSGKSRFSEVWGGEDRVPQKKTWFFGWLPAWSEFMPGTRWSESGYGPSVDELLQGSFAEVRERYVRFGEALKQLGATAEKQFREQWGKHGQDRALRGFLTERRAAQDFVQEQVGLMPSQAPPGDPQLHSALVCEAVLKNMIAGTLTGIKVVLAAVVYASLVFNGKGEPDTPGRRALEDGFGLGISLMLWTSFVAGVYNLFFGRLQYSVAGSRIVPAVILSEIAEEVAIDPVLQAAEARGERVMVRTMLMVICITTLSIGLFAFLIGWLRAADVVLRMPSPVTAGFLASVGWSAMRSSIKLSSSIPWHNPVKTPGKWWPKEWDTDCGFWSPNSICPVLCALGMFLGVKHLAPLCKEHIPGQWHKKFWTMFWTLLPLGAFHLITYSSDVSLDNLRRTRWVFDRAESDKDFWLVWTSLDPSLISNIPGSVVVKMVLSPVLSNVAALLTLMAATAAFPEGHPDGSPDQFEQIDFSQEMRALGTANIIAGCSGGIGIYHVIGFTIDHRNDGGTHRLGICWAMVIVGALFLSSSAADLASYFPKFFVAGIFLNMGYVLFDKGVVTPFEALGFSKGYSCRRPSCCGGAASYPDGRSRFVPCFSSHLVKGLAEWSVTAVCILLAMFTELIYGIGAAVILSFFIHLNEISAEWPLASEKTGHVSHVRSSRKRPEWEDEVLGKRGSRAVVLELKGALFFGTVENVGALLNKVLSANMDAGGDNDIEYIILDFSKVVSIDGSAGKLFSRWKAGAKRAGAHLLYCGADTSPAVRTAMEAFNIIPEASAQQPGGAAQCTEPPEGWPLQAPNEWAPQTEMFIRGVWFSCAIRSKRKDACGVWLYAVELLTAIRSPAKPDMEYNVPGECLRKKFWPPYFSTLDSALDWVEGSLIDDFFYKNRRLLATDPPAFEDKSIDRSPQHFQWMEEILLTHLPSGAHYLLVPKLWGDPVEINLGTKTPKRDSIESSLGVKLQDLEVVAVYGPGERLGLAVGMVLTHFCGQAVWENESAVKCDLSLQAAFSSEPRPVLRFQFADRIWDAAQPALGQELRRVHRSIAGMRRDSLDGTIKPRQSFTSEGLWGRSRAARTDFDTITHWLDSEASRWGLELEHVRSVLRGALDASREPASPGEAQQQVVQWVQDTTERAQELHHEWALALDLSSAARSVRADASSSLDMREEMLLRVRLCQLLASIVESSLAMAYRGAAEGDSEMADDLMGFLMQVPKNILSSLNSGYCVQTQYELNDTVFSPGSNMLHAPRSVWRDAEVVVRPQTRTATVRVSVALDGSHGVAAAAGLTMDGLLVTRAARGGAAWTAGVREGWRLEEMGEAESHVLVRDLAQADAVMARVRRTCLTFRLRITGEEHGTVIGNFRDTPAGEAAAPGQSPIHGMHGRIWLHVEPGVWHCEVPRDTLHLVRMQDAKYGTQVFSDEELWRLHPDTGMPCEDPVAMVFIRKGCLDTFVPGAPGEGNLPARPPRRTARQNAGNAAGEAHFLVAVSGRSAPHANHTFASAPTLLWVLTYESWMAMQGPKEEGGNPEVYQATQQLILGEMASDVLAGDAVALDDDGDWDGDIDALWGLPRRPSGDESEQGTQQCGSALGRRSSTRQLLLRAGSSVMGPSETGVEGVPPSPASTEAEGQQRTQSSHTGDAEHR
eukprot:TRINITY_DN9877_c0_g1_i2.p1 TRINITY_DN9877_c0_g1~~TRINITY_DN9877_c0_g1_i2.p1  ORF type:complete len:1968 (+),score=462.65 TRINITY_DN9877_c0_g1_i2:114-5906(+)